jgi:hypothetical protein
LAEILPALLHRRAPQAKAVKQRQSQRRLTAEQVAQLAQEYGAGDGMAVLAALWDLAERYDCDDETVRQALKRAHVRLRKPWERP